MLRMKIDEMSEKTNWLIDNETSGLSEWFRWDLIRDSIYFYDVKCVQYWVGTMSNWDLQWEIAPKIKSDRRVTKIFIINSPLQNEMSHAAVFLRFMTNSVVAVKTASPAASVGVRLPCFPSVRTELSFPLTRDTLELKHVRHSDSAASSAFTGPPLCRLGLFCPGPGVLWC